MITFFYFAANDFQAEVFSVNKLVKRQCRGQCFWIWIDCYRSLDKPSKTVQRMSKNVGPHFQNSENFARKSQFSLKILQKLKNFGRFFSRKTIFSIKIFQFAIRFSMKIEISEQKFPTFENGTNIF